MTAAVNISENRMVWVTVYGRRLCYGGPEEGGWWYDHDEVVESIQLPVRVAQEVLKAKQVLVEEANKARRPYHSVLGGYKEWVTIEDEKGQHATRHRPQYE